MSLRRQFLASGDLSSTVPLVTVTPTTEDCPITLCTNLDNDDRSGLQRISGNGNGVTPANSDVINIDGGCTNNDVSSSPPPEVVGGARRQVATVTLSSGTRHKRRLVHKTGECNISSTNVQQRKRRFIVDIFSTMLELKWRYNVLVFMLAFCTTWTFFGALWYSIVLIHGDHLHANDTTWEPCVKKVYDFTSAILFSIETQHTIGYGLRVPDNKCPEVVVIMMLQSCFGVFIQCLVTGVIFAKLSRPKRRAQTLVFSNNAVICLLDDQFYLMFRVADMRRSHLVGASIRAVLVKNRITKEGDALPLWQYPLQLKTESSIADDNYIFLAWPMTVMHRIDSDSPLWDISAAQLQQEVFEIIVNLEGTVENTGMTAQVRTSYLPAEILWGHRLTPLVTYQKENGHYTIDHKQFHSVIPVNIPQCSARTQAESLVPRVIKMHSYDVTPMTSHAKLTPMALSCDGSTMQLLTSSPSFGGSSITNNGAVSGADINSTEAFNVSDQMELVNRHTADSDNTTLRRRRSVTDSLKHGEMVQ